MDKFCSKCGRKLEEDGFCMNCMNFDRKEEEGTDPFKMDPVSNNAEPKNEDRVEPQRVEATNQGGKNAKGNGLALAITMIIAICMVGLFLISAASNFSMNFQAEDSWSNDSMYQSNEVENVQESEEAESDVVGSEEQGATSHEEVERYEVNYDEIVLAGEPCNGYHLFSCKKDDLTPLVNDYFADNEIETEFETSMDNYYMMEEGEKVTYYETYSDWNLLEDNGLYSLTSDSVTGNILYVNVIQKDIEKVIPLLRESLKIINPNLAESELLEMESAVRESSKEVRKLCGDYYIYGTYIDTSVGSYYSYYIFDMDEE